MSDGSRPGAVASLGEVVVEVMRTELDVPLDRTGAFQGPFASGAPAIFAAAAARLGADARFLGVLGRDAFGALCERGLRGSGVDARWLLEDAEATTGTAFVSYRGDGGRDFVFHLPRSAAAALAPRMVDDAFTEGLAWLHVTGSSLAVSDGMRDACILAAERARDAGATVSFDPNLRAEMMAPGAVRDLCAPILAHSHVVEPSGDEAALLTGIDDAERACRALIEGGTQLVLHKLGADGCRVHSAEGVRDAPTIPVDEVDPTGAGDCFAAGFAVARLEGMAAWEAASFANVVGALSTTVLGPVDGAPWRDRVEAARPGGR